MSKNILRELFEVGNFRAILNNLRNFSLDEYNADIVKCYTLLFLDDIKGAQIISSKYKNDVNFLLVDAYISFNQMDERKSFEIVQKIINSEDVLEYIKLESYVIAINSLVLLNNIQKMEEIYFQALDYAISKNLFVYKSIIDFIFYLNLNRIQEDEQSKKILLRTEFELKNYGNLNYYALNLLHNATIFATEYQFDEANKRIELAYEIITKIGSLSLLSRYYLNKYFVKVYENQIDFEDLNKALEYADISQNNLNKTLALNYMISYYIHKKEVEKAKNILKQYEELMQYSKRTSPRFLFTKAILSCENGNYKESIELIEKAMNLAKSKYQEISLKIYKCVVLKRMGNLNEAYNLLLELLNEKDIIYQSIEKDIMNELKPLFQMYLENNKELSENFIKLIIKLEFEEEFKIQNAYEYMDEFDIIKRIDKIKDKKILSKIKEKLKYQIYLFNKLKLIILDKVIYEEDFDRPITAKVFKYFVINRNRFIPKEKIFDELWPNDDPKKASSKLHTIVSNIRRILIDDEVIRSSGGAYGFFPDNRFYIDIEDFENSIKTAIAISYVNPEEAISRIIHAFDIYSGDLLEGDLYEEWIFVERERLKQLLSQGILVLSELLIKKNLENLAIAYLESSLFRNLDNKVFNMLLNLLKKHSLDDRLNFWNNYIQRLIR
ncbi:MAG: hypothetical protein ABIL45_00895 [candidate division WOR-3 bacterium]